VNEHILDPRRHQSAWPNEYGDTRAEAVIESLNTRSVVMASILLLKQSAINGLVVGAGVALLSSLAPTFAAEVRQNVDIFPDLQVSVGMGNDKNDVTTAVPARNRALDLTSQLPWRAPIGHRQPRKADVPPAEVFSTWERQQQRLDAELDGKLIICWRC
jgi:hypothetical protein